MPLTTPHKQRLVQIVNLASMVAVLTIAAFMGCTEAISDDGATGTGSPVTVGSGSDPVCKGGFRDGKCDALAAVKEDCDCLDCAGTAYCRGKCVDDGRCDAQERDNVDPPYQTCIDCYSDAGAGPAGPGPSSTAEATVTAASSAETTGDATTAQQSATTAPATTNAATAAATTAGGGGAMM